MSSSSGKGTSIKAKTAVTEQSMSDSANIDFDDQLLVDPAIKREIEDKGLVCRWINGVKHKANYGYDPRRWTPYKRDISDKSTRVENNFGYADPEGFIRRGDMILAVRPKAVHEAYKQKIASKNARLSGNHQKQAADELRQYLKDENLSGSVKVHEGYEEND